MINRLILQCRMVREPEVKTLRDGSKICEFTVCWNQKNSKNKKDVKLFQNCVSYGKMAELIERYFAKGQEMIVCGQLFTQQWETKEGVKKQQNKLTVLEAHFCGKKNFEKDISDFEEIPDEEIENLPW